MGGTLSPQTRNLRGTGEQRTLPEPCDREQRGGTGQQTQGVRTWNAFLCITKLSARNVRIAERARRRASGAFIVGGSGTPDAPRGTGTAGRHRTCRTGTAARTNARVTGTASRGFATQRAISRRSANRYQRLFPATRNACLNYCKVMANADPTEP